MIKGYVTRIVERQTKFGTMYSIQVGEDYIGTGKNKPTCKEGDFVEFAFKLNAKGYKELDGAVTVLTAPASPAEAGGAVSGSEKQLMISYQAARRDAITVVQLAHQLGLSLPLAVSGTGKSKGADFDSLLECVEVVTGQFMSKTFDMAALEHYIADEGDFNPAPGAEGGAAFSE